jgi:hypothetical protein
MGSLRQNTQAAGGDSNHQFHAGQKYGRQHGTQGYQSLLAIALLFQRDDTSAQILAPWML